MGYYSGTSGNDTVMGGEEEDWIYGYSGDDSLFGGDGNDTLMGGEDNDSLYGENGNDSLVGNNGNDYLTGGDGNDSLVGGQGNDTLVGGQGSDRFIYSTSSGVDVISGFETGNDKIVLYKTTFTSISSPVGEGLSDLGEFSTVTTDADAATSSADIVYNSVNGNLFYNANGSDPGLGTGSLLLTLTGVPTLVATDFMIKVSSDALSLYGGEDNDFLEGGDGDDTLNGGDGDDTLNGGDGKDSLEGGDGNDTLIGGQGSDYFRAVHESVFGSEFSGVDVISDFETGSDTILLDKWAFSEISSYSTDVWLGFKVPEEFGIVTCDTQATISTAIIVYNSVNGNLFYNTNGSDPGLGTGSLFATLAGAPTLVVTDFLLTIPYKLD